MSLDPLVQPGPEQDADATFSRPSSDVKRRLLRDPIAVAAAAILILLLVSAVVLPLVLSGDPNTADPTAVFAPPSSRHLLGTDSAGRDVFLRLVYASRVSFGGVAIALAVAAALGITFGLIAGYFGGWFETLSSWAVNLLMAIPGIIFLLAARAVLGPSFWLSMTLVGVLLAPGLFRVVYGSVRHIRHELYVDATRVAGLSAIRIIVYHVLAVVRGPIVIQISMLAGVALSIQAGLDFLGVGDINQATWGQVLNDGFTNIYVAPTLLLWPSILIALACVSFSLLGNSLRDAFERTTKTLPKKAARKSVRTAGRREDESNSTPVRSDTLLRVSGLCIAYPAPDGELRRVVDGVDLEVRSGEIHGIVGESGSGKSQTAFAIMDLLPDTAQITRGEIFFAGRPLTSSATRQLRGRAIGYIPQDPIANLDPSFTIGHHLTEPLRVVLSMTKRQAHDEALDLLKRVGIHDPERVYRSYPHEVSGGMAQRVLIAGALACSPQLLIADEPTTSLDVTVQADILDLLRTLQHDTGVSIVLITHNFGVVADICDSVSVMQHGQVVEHGTVREIFETPQHPYTRSLLDAVLDNPQPRGQLLHADNRERSRSSAVPATGEARRP